MPGDLRIGPPALAQDLRFPFVVANDPVQPCAMPRLSSLLSRKRCEPGCREQFGLRRMLHPQPTDQGHRHRIRPGDCPHERPTLAPYAHGRPLFACGVNRPTRRRHSVCRVLTGITVGRSLRIDTTGEDVCLNSPQTNTIRTRRSSARYRGARTPSSTGPAPFLLQAIIDARGE